MCLYILAGTFGRRLQSESECETFRCGVQLENITLKLHNAVWSSYIVVFLKNIIEWVGIYSITSWWPPPTSNCGHHMFIDFDIDKWRCSTRREPGYSYFSPLSGVRSSTCLIVWVVMSPIRYHAWSLSLDPGWFWRISNFFLRISNLFRNNDRLTGFRHVTQYTVGTYHVSVSMSSIDDNIYFLNILNINF